MTQEATVSVIHCLGAYINTTENWLYRLLTQLVHCRIIVATDRVLAPGFHLCSAIILRSPLQPRLWERQRITFWLRLRRALCRITYPWFLRWRLRNTQVDLVHSHFAQVGWRFRRLARWLDAAHVISFYGWDYVKLGQTNPKWQHRLTKLFAEADAFVCEGPHGKALLVQQGCPDEKVHVSRLGVETAEIPFFTRTKTSGKLRLLQLASFREKKGHIDTVAAFADALVQCPDMHLTLIGDSPGEVHDQVAALIAARGIGDKVTLQPGVPFDELHGAMREYDVFVHPSRHATDGDCEGGAPVVLLDAQATGMPIIATTHCDIPQEVVDGVTGILCTERDVVALAQAICRFCKMDGAEYARFAQAARRHVEEHFEASACAAQLEQIYARVVAARYAG